MNRKTSVFEIFRDPLLTIIALILLGTMWIIIPTKDDEIKSFSPDQIENDNEAIQSLEEDIADKEVLLKSLEHKLHELEKERKEARGKNDERRKKLEDELSREIAIEKEKSIKIKREIEELEKIISERRGIAEYSSEWVKNKATIYFEAVNNRLVLINDKNYDVDVFKEVYQGSIITRAKLTKKGSVGGESADEIEAPNSEFQTELNKHDPRKHYISFIVRKDSYSMFLKARQFCWQEGFAVAWQPLDGPMYAVPVEWEDEEGEGLPPPGGR